MLECWQQVHSVRASEYEHRVTPQRSYSGGHGHVIAPQTPASPEPPEIPPGFAMIAPNVLVPISALQSSYSSAPSKPQQPPAYSHAPSRMQVWLQSLNTASRTCESFHSNNPMLLPFSEKVCCMLHVIACVHCSCHLGKCPEMQNKWQLMESSLCRMAP